MFNKSGQPGRQQRRDGGAALPRLRGEPDRSVPFIAISPFSKPHYVSHEVSDHTSVLALIEKRFMVPFGQDGDADDRPHLTRRDQFADTLEDMFDFENSPSLNTTVGTAAPPANDCGPFSGVSSTP